ncbi:MAG TPA: hypothetical protein VE645_18780 [Pseudonocardiaceae bacterium]|nr:hypothetical protein [Pseudonocardiaceae bacterium]
METGIGDIHTAMLAALGPARAAALCGQVTIDLDTTDVEVYSRQKRGVVFNHQGQRCGRRTWSPGPRPRRCCRGVDGRQRGAPRPCRAAAGSGAGRAACCGAGRADPAARRRRLLRRAAGPAAMVAQVEFAIGAKRIAPLWRILDGLREADRTDAIDMHGAQVAVADHCPDWWPAATRLLIRRVRRAPEQISADPCARQRRTPAPRPAGPADHRTRRHRHHLRLLVYRDQPGCLHRRAGIAVEHWYRHRTAIENVFKDAKLGAALRHLPSGYVEVNTAWMWGALLAASIAGWLHQLTGILGPAGQLLGHGVRGGQVMNRHASAPADPGTRPAGPPRRCPRPATTPGIPPAQQGPRPPPHPPRNALTRPYGPGHTSPEILRHS